jgi:hypothetical protein
MSRTGLPRVDGERRFAKPFVGLSNGSGAAAQFGEVP